MRNVPTLGSRRPEPSGADPRAITSPYDGTALIAAAHLGHDGVVRELIRAGAPLDHVDRKSTRLNSSHANISYAVFCLKKKNHLLHYFFFLFLTSIKNQSS